MSSFFASCRTNTFLSDLANSSTRDTSVYASTHSFGDWCASCMSCSIFSRDLNTIASSVPRRRLISVVVNNLDCPRERHSSVDFSIISKRGRWRVWMVCDCAALKKSTLKLIIKKHKVKHNILIDQVTEQIHTNNK